MRPQRRPIKRPRASRFKRLSAPQWSLQVAAILRPASCGLEHLICPQKLPLFSTGKRLASQPANLANQSALAHANSTLFASPPSCAVANAAHLRPARIVCRQRRISGQRAALRAPKLSPLEYKYLFISRECWRGGSGGARAARDCPRASSASHELERDSASRATLAQRAGNRTKGAKEQEEEASWKWKWYESSSRSSSRRTTTTMSKIASQSARPAPVRRFQFT